MKIVWIGFAWIGIVLGIDLRRPRIVDNHLGGVDDCNNPSMIVDTYSMIGDTPSIIGDTPFIIGETHSIIGDSLVHTHPQKLF